MPPHYLVIGSGPSGTAAATALLDAGARVTLVDTGADLTQQTRDHADGIAQQPELSSDDRRWIQRGVKADGGGIPLKSLFGEDFMYAWGDVADAALPENFGQWPSRALGG